MHQTSRGNNHLNNTIIDNLREQGHGGYGEPYPNQQYAGMNHEMNHQNLPSLHGTLPHQHDGMAQPRHMVVGTPEHNFNFARVQNGGNDVNVNENFSK